MRGCLSHALGYERADSVSRLYDRNKDEFGEDMAGTVNLTVPGNPMSIPVRIFSPRGCHLIGFLAKTAKAKAFRKWVLDVLELAIATQAPKPIALLSPQKALLLKKTANRKLVRGEVAYIRQRGKHIGKIAGRIAAQAIEEQFVEQTTALVLEGLESDFAAGIDLASEKIAARACAAIDAWKLGVFW
jgi:prophage antirepressor-like protein